jgi:hypothetical protein
VLNLTESPNAKDVTYSQYVQYVYGTEENVDEEQGQASDMRSSQSRDGPHRFHYLPDLILSKVYHGVNRT